MNSIIIYQSLHHQNTEQVANAMAETLGCEAVKVHELGERKISDYDLVGFGSGIFYSKHHRSLIEFSEKLGQKQHGKAFVFSTSGMTKLKSHDMLKKILVLKGYGVIDEFTCPGFDTWGPLKLIGGIKKNRPNDEDLEKAKAFVKKLLP